MSDVNSCQEHSNNSSLNDNDDVALSNYIDDFERMIQENLTNGQDLYTQKLFLAFQNAATNVTKMFRERSNGTNNWNSFHTAAESVTMLYKESLDALKDAIQLGILNGEQRKSEDLLRWTHRKQRRHIRTEEIYDYLMHNRPSNYPNSTEIFNTTAQPAIVDDLHTFRQALAMNDNGNKSGITIGTQQNSEQLENFVRQQVDNQLARKRRHCSTDIISNDFQKMKRPRYT